MKVQAGNPADLRLRPYDTTNPMSLKVFVTKKNKLKCKNSQIWSKGMSLLQITVLYLKAVLVESEILITDTKGSVT